jgi:hypothetical protein
MRVAFYTYLEGSCLVCGVGEDLQARIRDKTEYHTMQRVYVEGRMSCMPGLSLKTEW